jgi:hypothetical protein
MEKCKILKFCENPFWGNWALGGRPGSILDRPASPGQLRKAAAQIIRPELWAVRPLGGRPASIPERPANSDLKCEKRQ